jgi:5'-nucleotidase
MEMKNILIPNKEEYEATKNKIIKGGTKQLYVLADFDKTLTYPTTKDGKPIHSVISLLRDRDYISTDYQKRAKELFKKYHPLENNPKMSFQERKQAMKEWWTKHFELLISSGLNRKDLEKIVESREIRLRDGFENLADLLHRNNIPLLILSANGVGNTIPMILKKEGIFYNNIYIVTNIFEFDREGRAIKVLEPVIHSLNKDETEIKKYPVYQSIKNRKNVILLGDSLGDLEMTRGVDSENVLKIGFLSNIKDKETLEAYKHSFDVLIPGDSNMSFVNKLIKEVIDEK